jgi:hypothetical protein
MSDEKISALLSDDRYDSKDWRHADLAGRIEWLIFMLKAKGEEVENMVRLAEPMLSDALAAAEKHIEELEAKLATASHNAAVFGHEIVDLEAKLAMSVLALEAWLNVAAHCSIEEGVCCCGDDMGNHSPPMVSGHTPLDHGNYIAGRLEETTRAILAELKGQEDE